jgi:hypothetical protein
LTYPGEYFGKQNLSRTIQNRFGFHYAADPMWEGIQHLPAEQPAEVTMGERSSNMFYTFAEQVRALALMRAVQKREAPKVCDEKASKKEIEAAAIELCHAYRPVRNAIDAFINDLLVAILQSLQPKSERLSLHRREKRPASASTIKAFKPLGIRSWASSHFRKSRMLSRSQYARCNFCCVSRAILSQSASGSVFRVSVCINAIGAVSIQPC